ncbi:NHLP bacteriocin export ABC transporter permease/ATPase subunit [Desulfosporosinus lacus]|uniref:NHLM bacteriocin system ABC transporter, ATP-binding protein n=1 Tax=Desulfosporosinus lacus DSM 15449 TaxID=1121420 RepID=A0A1M5QWE4_9FIRM|nr:NHLP bacteriocin export ABC transporter permease/ATPase subunit [Desulfosporosinus lacus]SHH18497.1 NHLM bacteriocin system ABC transporter, ATP-binding protein [Desulfosporosinus lacus DSM 15449]
MTRSFDQQLQKRLENDQKAMEGSFYELAVIVGNKREEILQSKEKQPAVKGEIERILTFLRVKVPSLPEGVTDVNEQLEYMLRPSGVMRRRVELKGSWWKDGTGPLLGSTISGEAVAIMPRFPSGYDYFDADIGKKVKVNAKTADKLNDEGFCFYRPLPAKKLSITDLVFYILRSISHSDIALVLGASLLVSLLGMFTPYMSKQIFDSVIPSGTKSDVFPVAGLLIGATLGSVLFGITRSIVLLRFRDKISMSVQSAAMARVFSLPATFFKDYSAGELSSRTMSINQLCSMLSDSVMTSGLTALFSFVYIIQMQTFASSLVAPAMLIIISMLVFTILTGLLQIRLLTKQTKLSAKMNGLVFQLFNGIQKVKLAGAEKRVFSKWVEKYKNLGKVTYSPPLLLKIQGAVSGALTLGGSLILYYFAARSNVSVSNYIAFTVAYGSVSAAILQLSEIVMSLANIKPLLEMVKPILETVPEIDETKKIVTGLSGSIEMNNITFRYTENGPAILNNLSLRVKPGEYVGIVGKTGCGKSTLMRILLGFEKPESGAVYYDGSSLESLDVRSVRQNMGVVMQSGKLFSGDIFSNIIVTAPWLTLEDAWQAARMAGVEEDILAMPMGMHTVISEGSGGISGGQRQRIMIARAIAAKPKILFFDEATSALDNITQKIVSESLATLNCTRIVIAHRLSTIKMCDKILVFDRGVIVEEGTFEELMAKEGLFHEFASRQMA